MNERYTLALSTLILTTAMVLGQSGTLDPTLNAIGSVTQGQGQNSLYGTAMAVRPNGNIIMAGTASTGFNGTNKQMAYTELSPVGEILALNFFGADDRNDFTSAVAIQPDGKIILVGYSALASTPFFFDMELIRVDVDGTLDETFGVDGIVITDLSANDIANAVSVLPSGKILVGGIGSDGPDKMLLVQYLADGGLDVDGFGVGGYTYAMPADEAQTSMINAMKVLADGRILAVGSTYLEGDKPILARFDPSGALDATFGDAGFASVNGFFGLAYSLDLQSDGKIIIGNMGDGGMEAFRFTSDGVFDPTFGFLGVVSTFIYPPNTGVVQPTIALVQPDDRLVLVGTNETEEYVALRFTPNGNPDATFGTAGTAELPGTDRAALCAAQQPDGKLLLGGFVSNNVGTRSFYTCRLINELTVGVEDLTTDGTTVLIYPNPIYDEATFSYALDHQAIVSIQLFDTKGQLVRTVLGNTARQAGQHQEILDVAGLSAGVYTLVLTNGEATAKVNLVKN